MVSYNTGSLAIYLQSTLEYFGGTQQDDRVTILVVIIPYASQFTPSTFWGYTLIVLSAESCVLSASLLPIPLRVQARLLDEPVEDTLLFD